LYRLIQKAGGDLEAAQRGNVYIDEIDKLRMSGTVGKDTRLGVQHALLKMLEGTIATVPPAGGWKHPMQPGTKTVAPPYGEKAAHAWRGHPTSSSTKIRNRLTTISSAPHSPTYGGSP
jgi:hypothetical protein